MSGRWWPRKSNFAGDDNERDSDKHVYMCATAVCVRALLQNYVKEDKVTNAVDMPVSASAGRGCVFL